MFKNIAALLVGVGGAVALAVLGAAQGALGQAGASLDMSTTEGMVIALVLGVVARGVNYLIGKLG